MIRRATVDDAAAVAAVEDRVDPDGWTAATAARHLSGPLCRAWVVDDGVVVAHLITTVVADEAEVITIAVHPEHRRRGHARALLDAAAIAWAAEGVRRAFLEVHVDNVGARSLYAGAGWSEVGRRRGYYADGGDALLLARDLSPTG